MSDKPEITAPPKKLQVGSHELRMPYAMLMDLSRMLPDPAQTMNLVMSDPVTQDYIVRRVMTPLDKIIQSSEDLVSADEVDLDIDEVEQVLTWVVQHLLYFFVKRTQGLGRVGAEFKQALPNRSSPGSETSPSMEPSAGPST